jgi:hypothetical protein
MGDRNRAIAGATSAFDSTTSMHKKLSQAAALHCALTRVRALPPDSTGVLPPVLRRGQLGQAATLNTIKLRQPHPVIVASAAAQRPAPSALSCPQTLPPTTSSQTAKQPPAQLQRIRLPHLSLS